MKIKKDVTPAELVDSQKKTDRQQQESDCPFNFEWGDLIESLVKGDLIESLVKGDLVKLFSQRDMSAEGTSQRVEKIYNQKQYQFDILVYNGEDIIVVEVKTILEVEDVKHFLDKLENFKKMFDEYREKKIYGAVAYIEADENSQTYAQNKKLFVIRGTGGSTSIINPMDFKPRIF